jgi:hypothetical protein
MTMYYVATTGSDSANGSFSTPWATIQKSANTVAAGDTVNVAPGTYNESVSIQANGTATSPITFISTVKWGAKITSNGSATYAVQMGSNNNPPTSGNYIIFNGFDVGNNANLWDGILVWSKYCQILNNRIHDVPATGSGGNGGSGVDSCNFYGSNNTFANNWVFNIGSSSAPNTSVQGIYISNPNCLIYNNIVFNIAAYGLQTWHAATNDTFSNNLVFNTGYGGILIGDGDAPGNVTCDYCVVSDNISIYNNVYAPEGYGIREYGATGTHNVYLNNCVYGNNVNVQLLNGLVAQNTVASDPKLVKYRSDGTGDYHLTYSSPCVNRGTSTGVLSALDLDGVARPQIRASGNGYDIGPYEYVSSNSGILLTL